MISSGCSLATASRTACSTSLASRTLRVSTPSFSRSPPWPFELAAFVAAISSPDHPSKGVAEAHKSALGDGHARTRGALSSIVIEAFPRTIRYLRSEEHTSELQSLTNLVCRLLLEKKK